jgi:hypothetical protein
MQSQITNCILETTILYDKATSVAQIWDHWHVQWRPLFRQRRWSLGFNLLFIVGILVSFFIGDGDFFFPKFIILMVLLFSTLSLPIKYLRSYFEIRALSHKLPVQMDILKLGFGDAGIWYLENETRLDVAWDQLISYQLQDDLLKIFYAVDRWPMIFSKPELGAAFLWELIAAMDRQMALRQAAETSLEADANVATDATPDAAPEQP